MHWTNKIDALSSTYQPLRNKTAGGPSRANNDPQPVMPVDQVHLSQKGLQAAYREGHGGPTNHKQDLTSEEREVVNELKRRDAEVKAHEQAHMTAGGGIVRGGATYQFQTGPDGRMYAVGGEVNIDLSTAGSPEATIRKMQQVQAAAMAPAHPSGTDRAVAAQAAQIEAMARLEQTQEREAETASLVERVAEDPGQPTEAIGAGDDATKHIDLMA